MDYVIRIPANKNLELEIEFCFRRAGSLKPLGATRASAIRQLVEAWRVVAKVEHHQGELFPRVGFIA